MVRGNAKATSQAKRLKALEAQSKANSAKDRDDTGAWKAKQAERTSKRAETGDRKMTKLEKQQLKKKMEADEEAKKREKAARKKKKSGKKSKGAGADFAAGFK